MNLNISVLCDTCQEQTNCRLGFSNREYQPLRFRCASCGAPIDITMTLNFENVGADIQVKNAKRIYSEEFKPETNFVDLHLDFPVSFGKYIMGITPFIAASMRIDHKDMPIHAIRIEGLNKIFKQREKIKNIFTLYKRNKHELFKEKSLEFLGSKMGCDTELDRNRALYFVIERAFFPFSEPKKKLDTVAFFKHKLIELESVNKEALFLFINKVVENGFLKNTQKDCLEVYPRIIDIELMLRPALFLDFDKQYENCPVPYRVSSHEFLETKDLYKDIAEIISRALVLVAGINNLLKRDSHDVFAAKKRTPSNLDKFTDFSLGEKLNYIDDSWYSLSGDVMDNHLRNSIAHYKVEYNDVTQEIIYYPKREGMKQKCSESMYFLDFSRRILLAFRELHRLNLLTKCLFNFYYLEILGWQGTPYDL
ncbi:MULTISPECIES: hypothetical protein [Dethiosulfovibrio]|uniref:ApeA N-terminal domain-containing protein n=2 Tax=Dethiosulfovibrio TaxID=47054 RepID=A0ABS9EKY9_9BACT|nr:MULTISPECIES: hypothetical protein [Dethiosulfovibrio]MCF4113718.1 hypothetical protein [Dethiosulfovibrio russensis]MCF4141869.1 hypothetical protein [Dethiosulfovibrio marinus]MCF4143713.1 hypothetical protein [Dethiosulfovibrio acidaminovorans]